MMDLISKTSKVEHYLLKDNGRFPNNGRFPVLIYRKAFNIHSTLDILKLRVLLKKHGWGNTWKAGIFSYHHYHSNTHELLAVCKGSTRLLLGGDDGRKVKLNKGDVIIIPAGVAHKNLKDENDVVCIGAYPGGVDYDMNYDRPGERPKADKKIKKVGIPKEDPLTGRSGNMHKIWK
jgi:uncharacterized protein YjlB